MACRRAVAHLHELAHKVLVRQKQLRQRPDAQDADQCDHEAEQHIGPVKGRAHIGGGQVPEQLRRQRHIEHKLVGPGHECIT